MASGAIHGQRPSKRVRLLSDDEDSGDESPASLSSSSSANVIEANGDSDALRINSEYAKRFEHNKKREELHRLEDKYGRNATQEDSGDEEDSDDVPEDDAAELATRELDDEIAATLQAIKNKDKRLYDKDNVFYKSLERTDDAPKEQRQPKPVTLQDYHRQNLLSGAAADEDDNETGGVNLNGLSEQQSLKNDLLSAANVEMDGSNSDDDDFFKKRPGQDAPMKRPSPPRKPLDADGAEKDPETFLSNFMSSRAWVPNATSKWKAFESDDEDDEAQADRFEDAYNMRFEDPNLANQTLLSHSRKAVADYSVRREKTNSRKRARDSERAKKDEERQEREQEKTRLRNLKLEKAAEKLKQFKDAAGVRTKNLDVDDWNAFLDAGWDSDNWDKEMQRRFGEQYYAEKEVSRDSDRSKRHEKPEWDDDIAIDDIVPDFTSKGDEADFSLSEDDAGGPHNGDATDANGEAPQKARVDGAKARTEKQRAKRKERRQLEELVDKSVVQDMLPATKKPTGPFRYRDTSPTSFGLSSHDILMADDTALNQFAGLKKLASFRDAERKRRDAKKLGKSAHLRQWRKETFGDEQGPNHSFQEYVGSKMAKRASGAEDAGDAVGALEEPDIVTGSDKKKKKKRSRKRKVEVDA